MFFDESTSTLEKSKELNKILVEELQNLQAQLDELIDHRKVENNKIDVHQESITAPLDDGNTDSDQNKNSNSTEKEKKEKREFDCSICHNKFATKFSLERHQKLHSKEISENYYDKSINVQIQELIFISRSQITNIIICQQHLIENDIFLETKEWYLPLRKLFIHS